MASRSQTEQQQTSVDIAEVLAELANKIDRLKTLYEQYFMGIEKMEPQVARKEVTRAMLQLQQTYIRNTALRFKFNTMLQKWNIYVTYWNRVLREIENGTYVRHLAKAKRAAERAGRELPSEMASKKLRAPAFSLDEETQESKPNFLDVDTGVQPPGRGDDFDLEEVWDRVAPTESKKHAIVAPPPSRPAPPPAQRATPPAQRATPPSAPPPPAQKAPPRPPAAALLPKIPGMNEPELRALHERYVAAQRAAGNGRGVKYETLVQSLAKQVPALMSEPGVKSVRFDVAVQNGKPILKATPQK